MYGYSPPPPPVDYVLSVNNTYPVLQRMGCIRYEADNRIQPILRSTEYSPHTIKDNIAHLQMMHYGANDASTQGCKFDALW